MSPAPYYYGWTIDGDDYPVLGRAAVVYRLAHPSWFCAEQFAGDLDRFSAKFLSPCGPQRVERGEDLPGSWHQQQNGGRRLWASVSGEFEAA